MKMPNGQEAVIDVAKLRDYCLSRDHLGSPRTCTLNQTSTMVSSSTSPRSTNWCRGRKLRATGKNDS